MKNEAEETEVGVSSGKTHTDEIRTKNRSLIESSFKSMCPELLEWIGAFSRRGKNPVDAMVLNEEPSERGSVFKVDLFTERHIYHITAIPASVMLTRNTDSYAGYLGMTVSSRKSRAGEDWTRGSDLADGSYSDRTWQCVMADIISYELVRLGK